MIINFEGVDFECDDELSFRDFTGWDFRDRPEYDFNNKIIYASCFSQEEPDKPIFGDNLVGTTFIKCNLDNVFLG